MAMIELLQHAFPLLFLFFLLPLLLFRFIISTAPNKKDKSNSTLPRSYPLIGSYLAIKANAHRRIQWISDILIASPAATFTLHGVLGRRFVITANPAVVHHILKTQFSNYRKGAQWFETLHDFLGNGIFNADDENWKFQRQVASHEFNTKSLRKFVQEVVDAELSDRLLPILASAAASSSILDFQDVLERFAFDSICRIAFGYDPKYLAPSSERSKFAEAFQEATEISSRRFREPLPLIWKIKRKLNIGNEKRLRIAVSEVRDFAKELVREKKRELQEKESLESADMLSRFLSSGHSEEEFVTDIVISFILAGKDSTSAALTWFFWLLSKNPRVEKEILKEMGEKSGCSVYDEVKEMVYTQAALCESMRLYPPVPADTKEAAKDDVLPDGTKVKKGTRVTYHVYAMGRMESLWGPDWEEFRPERWLERREGEGEGEGRWMFVTKDSYTYPVFQAGPRLCLGKEMSFLQMKRLVAAILTRFRVLPTAPETHHPPFISFLTSHMQGGFPVRIQLR